MFEEVKPQDDTDFKKSSKQNLLSTRLQLFKIFFFIHFNLIY